MKEKIINLLGDKLDKLNVYVDDAYVETEDDVKYLRIVLDADKIIPLNTVVMATRIINPLIDKENLIDDTYILDVYAKSKGDDSDE